ncbi:hypothetical protein DFJ77DRAFT_456995 [Powellomyces hirtus]|nr:hypothetical protein DFJ77DRAFT_456995 [Powellomyces hirtus]
MLILEVGISTCKRGRWNLHRNSHKMSPPQALAATNPTILDIISNHKEEDEDTEYEGCKILTTGPQITVLIDNFKACCEEFGVQVHFPAGISAESELIGATVLTVRWGKGKGRDTAPGYSARRSAVVEVETNRGTFEIEAWNTHTGVYTHVVRVAWDGYSDQQEV